MNLYSAYVRSLQGVSDYLKDDLPPSSPGLSKWAQEVGRRACRKYARQRGNIPFLTNDPTWDGMCSGYLGSINEGPTSGGSYGPPYTGGQCSILYKVFFTAKSIRKSDGVVTDTQTDFSIFNGPILGAISCEGGSCGIPGLPTPAYISWIISGSLSDSGEIGGGQKVTIGNRRYIAQGFSGSSQLFRSTLQITSVTPNTSGQPDNCGSLPNQYQPPTFPSNLPALPNPSNPAPGLGNNWEVNLLPDGEINICVGGECSASAPPAGGNGPDSGGGSGQEDGAATETNPNTPNTPNQVSGCVGAGRVLTGLKIQIIQAPPNYQGLGEIYYRSCWVWMGPNSNLLDMVTDGKAIENGQFVIPDSRDCTCYKVRANPGFRVRVQAYSRPKKE